nr:hypothetical protein [uncultured Anaerostipes sp.]
MKKLYQSELYTKHHWKIVGTILFVLILVGGKFKGNIFFPRFAYFTLAAILFLAQIAVIAMCEEDAEKRKQEYKEGIKYFALPILLLLCDIHSDWVYSY